MGCGKGVRLIDLAERIRALTRGASKVEILEERAPEVGRFVADVSTTCTLFGLKCLNDLIEHLPRLIEHAKS